MSGSLVKCPSCADAFPTLSGFMAHMNAKHARRGHACSSARFQPRALGLPDDDDEDDDDDDDEELSPSTTAQVARRVDVLRSSATRLIGELNHAGLEKLLEKLELLERHLRTTTLELEEHRRQTASLVRMIEWVLQHSAAAVP